MPKFERRETWVGVFDILGFKNIISNTDNEYNLIYLESQLNDLFEAIDKTYLAHGNIEVFSFSDTFIILTKDLDISSYPWFLLQCRELINRSIEIQLPLRGAISVGTIFESRDPLIFLGSPFVEAYEYAEDQDWIGLLLTPTATDMLRKCDLEPMHHDFIENPNDIPLRRKAKIGVLAYRFQNGATNYETHLIHHLELMKAKAPDIAKDKYTRTIEFIRKYYQWL
jgi:hypothetical protein